MTSNRRTLGHHRLTGSEGRIIQRTNSALKKTEPGGTIDESGDTLAIVIATYNEIDNLPTLITDLTQRLPDAKIVVVDDDSPDGTGQWCREHQSHCPALHVIHRRGKLGLGSATITGMQWALDNGYQLVATMDGDFSHSPADLSRVINAVGQIEATIPRIAIGSRYVAGGRIEGWPLSRHIASLAVNWLARHWLKLKTHDNSSAFRVYSAQALNLIDPNAIESSSYAFLEELLWRLQNAGVDAIEVPITFRNRQRGATKTNWRLGLSVFAEILRMPWRSRVDGIASRVRSTANVDAKPTD